ncbi:MAG TPA: 50S ribosomal protein L25/general stress protein Ctc [Burkholderiaceae bacterium]|nr:50S ribosomal protein L25/general stress protein Ctc [Burkholderiaceae bacterium]
MKVNATSRSNKGTSASRRLRRAGRVPAILYGAGKDAVSIELDHNEIYHSLLKPEFHASILDIQLDSKVEQGLVRAVQWHPYRPLVLHVDFQRVRATDPITTLVPLSFVNAEQSPAVVVHHQVVSHIMTELEITCLPADLPTSIEVELGELDDAGNVYLSDIALPEGVTYAGTEEDPVLAAALVRRGTADEDEDEVEDEDTAADDSGEDADEEEE